MAIWAVVSVVLLVPEVVDSALAVTEVISTVDEAMGNNPTRRKEWRGRGEELADRKDSPQNISIIGEIMVQHCHHPLGLLTMCLRRS